MFATSKEYPLDTGMIIFWFMIELLFAFDILFNFLREYRSEDSFKPIRDISKIASRYIRSQFLLDAIATFPFNFFITLAGGGTVSMKDKMNYSKFIYLLKVVRIRKASEIMKSSYLSKVVDSFYETRLRRMVKSNGHDYVYDQYKDYNKIMQQIRVKIAFKMFRFGTNILVYSYFLALFWYILTEINFYNKNPESKDQKWFFEEYNLLKKTNM